MLGHRVIAALIAGALLALPYVLHAGRRPNPYPWFGAGLLLAAAVYPAFALAAADRSAVLLELGGVLLFGAWAAAGVRSSPVALAFAWLAHGAWDLGLHPVGASGYTPWWYPAVCIGFDLLVAGFVLALAVARRAPGSAGEPPR